MIEVAPGVAIREEELVFTASRSGGPGGQHVNKTSTRVTLRFDLDATASLTPEQKARIRRKLGSRVAADGTLRVVSQRERSQFANRAAAIERFVELIGEALRPERPRKPTRVPRSERERRLESKSRTATRKRERSRPVED